MSFNPKALACIAVTMLHLTYSASLSAQEQLGMRFERSAGLYGAVLNPAQTAFMPQPWEVNLVSTEVFFENNYAYLTNTGVLHALGHLDAFVQLSDTASVSAPFNSGKVKLGYFSGRHPMHGVLKARVTGPGVAIRLGDAHVVGFSTAIRAESSSYRLPEALQAGRLEARKRFEPLRVTPVNAGLLTWGEVALHYSYRYSGELVTIAAGVNPKMLYGFEAGFARSSGNLEFTWTQLDSMTFSSGNWDVAMTTGNMEAAGQISAAGHLDAAGMVPQVNGFGAGLDLGVVVALPDFDDPAEEAYRWRFGFALNDLGLIRFHRRSEHHHFGFDTLRVVAGTDFSSERDMHKIIEMANRELLGAIGQSLQAQRFTAALPSALTLQADCRVRPNLYLGTVLVQRVPVGKFAVKRTNTFAVVPRFESRWLSVTAPVVLNDWQSVRVGLAFRLGYLTIGTDKLNSFFRQDQFTGSDLYVGLKVNGWERVRRPGNGLSRLSRRKIRCSAF